MKGQSKLESIIEVMVARLVGLLFSFLGNIFFLNGVLHLNLSLKLNLIIAVFFFCWSVLYNYFLRRFWNWWYVNKKHYM